MNKIRIALILCIIMFIQLHAQTTATLDMQTLKGKQLSEVFDLLMEKGFTSVAPVPVQSNQPKETVLGIKIRGQDVKSNTPYPVNSRVRVLVSMGSEDLFEKPNPMNQPNPPPPGNPQSLVIETNLLVMIGNRVESLIIDTDELIMTGVGVGTQSLEIETQPLIMDGFRDYNLVIQTDELIMIGLGKTSVEIRTDELVMNGLRGYNMQIQTDELVMTGLLEIADVDQPSPSTIDQTAPVNRPLLQSTQTNQNQNTTEPVNPMTAGPLYTPSHAALHDSVGGVRVDSVGSIPSHLKPATGPTPAPNPTLIKPKK